MPKPKTEKIDPQDLPDLAKTAMKNAKFPMLATIEEDQPRVRPVSPVWVDNFTIYIANLASYQKTKQIRANPKVELCYLDTDHNQVRITGIAEIVEDKQLIQSIWDKNKLLQQYLGDIDNPELIVYRILPEHVRYMQEWALNYYDVPLKS